MWWPTEEYKRWTSVRAKRSNCEHQRYSMNICLCTKNYPHLLCIAFANFMISPSHKIHLTSCSASKMLTKLQSSSKKTANRAIEDNSIELDWTYVCMCVSVQVYELEVMESFMWKALSVLIGMFRIKLDTPGVIKILKQLFVINLCILSKQLNPKLH